LANICIRLKPIRQYFRCIFVPMSFECAGKNFRLGILGGGQLGRMLIQEAINLNISSSVMDPDANAPCRHLCDHFVNADFRNEEAVYAFGKECSMITVEIEHVNTQALLRLEAEGIPVFPQPHLLQLVQDKGLQKQFYQSNGIPTAPFKLVDSKADLANSISDFPMMLKLRIGGYDGKGVIKLKSVNDIPTVFDGSYVVEEMIDFAMEIAVIVSRNVNGEINNFPVVEMEFNPEANLVEFLCSPARIEKEMESKAISIARDVIDKMKLVGVLAVEMFVTKSGEILVNEIAPRPHNSGHQTIEGNVTSQYAQHLRAIMNLPLGNTETVRPAVMINLLGEAGHEGEAIYQGIEEVLSWPGVYVHLYGKKITKPFRKMGHVTITAVKLDDAITLSRKVQATIKVVSN
jgi:5-(carboxyamino)imidazole ribonucleotide synthase